MNKKKTRRRPGRLKRKTLSSQVEDLKQQVERMDEALAAASRDAKQAHLRCLDLEGQLAETEYIVEGYRRLHGIDLKNLHSKTQTKSP